MDDFQLLIPLIVVGAFIAIVLYSLSLQRRATYKQDISVNAQAEAMEMVKRSVALQERSLAVATEVLAELKKLNDKTL